MFWSVESMVFELVPLVPRNSGASFHPNDIDDIYHDYHGNAKVWICHFALLKCQVDYVLSPGVTSPVRCRYPPFNPEELISRYFKGMIEKQMRNGDRWVWFTKFTI
jgi:hypothetical protein